MIEHVDVARTDTGLPAGLHHAIDDAFGLVLRRARDLRNDDLATALFSYAFRDDISVGASHINACSDHHIPLNTNPARPEETNTPENTYTRLINAIRQSVFANRISPFFSSL